MSEFNEELENLIKSGDTSPEARKEKQKFQQQNLYSNFKEVVQNNN